MSRIHYYVSPGGGLLGGQWQVTRDGTQVSYFGTQTAAAQDAGNRARIDHQAGHDAQVHIQRPDGRYRTEWTYGNDPRDTPDRGAIASKHVGATRGRSTAGFVLADPPSGQSA